MEFSIITLLCRKYPFFHDVAGTADPGTLGVIIILPISQDTYKLVRAFGARFEDAPIQKTLRHPCIREGNMARAFSIQRNIPKILDWYGESLQKIWKFWRENQMERKFSVIIWVYLAMVPSEISENAVSFASGNFPKCKSEISVESRAPLINIDYCFRISDLSLSENYIMPNFP